MINKLHLGCSDKIIEGFTNIDIIYRPGVTLDNAKILKSYKENSVDLIYVSNLLEHYSRWEYKTVLQRWYEILKPSGVLRLSVPDFEALCKYYIETKKLRDISGLIYGGQDYPSNQHCWCWDFDLLKKDLESVGFKNIRRWDWRKTEHSHIDDFSQAYLPHMDKENGTLVVLNVECDK